MFLFEAATTRSEPYDAYTFMFIHTTCRGRCNNKRDRRFRHQHSRSAGGRYPYQEKSAHVLQELDLRPGDVVVDIGAGDGWWARKMADRVGSNGVIHAAEVEQQKVDRMRKQFVDMPQIKPYLCPTDGTGLLIQQAAEADWIMVRCEMITGTYHHIAILVRRDLFTSAANRPD